MSCCGNFGGFAPKLEMANELFDEKSGASEEKLPTVKENEVKVVRGQTIQEPDYRYRLDQFYLKGKHLGTVQVKDRTGHRVITRVGDWAVIGYDLRWMLRKNGYRLEVVS